MISSLNLHVSLEASESTRMRVKESLPKYHEDHITGEEDNSLQHYNLVHKFIPMPQSHENSCSKGSSGEGMGETRKDSCVGPDESQK